MIEAGFLDDIIAHPDDDAPRLIYADWLEDQGRDDQARFIRTQIELATSPYHQGRLGRLHEWPGAARPGAQEPSGLDARWRLVRDLAPRFRPARAAALRCWVWRRGFIEEVSASGGALAAVANFMKSHPVRHLRVARVRQQVKTLASARWLSRLVSLELGTVGPDDLDALACSPHLANLVQLVLHSQTPDDLRRLLGSASLRPLKTLSFSQAPSAVHVPGKGGLHLYVDGASEQVTDDDVERLAAWAALGSVQELRFDRGNLTDRAILHLALSRYLGSLRRLEMRVRAVSDEVASALVEGPGLNDLDRLSLPGAIVSPQADGLLRGRFGSRLRLSGIVLT
jgi:uncharacterized protein (TIGR02996 family)